MAKCSYCGQEGHNILKCPVKPGDDIKKALKKVALTTVIGAVISGSFSLAVALVQHDGLLTADFFSGFIIGLLVGAGIGFGFGIIYVLNGFFSRLVARFKKADD